MALEVRGPLNGSLDGMPQQLPFKSKVTAPKNPKLIREAKKTPKVSFFLFKLVKK